MDLGEYLKKRDQEIGELEKKLKELYSCNQAKNLQAEILNYLEKFEVLAKNIIGKKIGRIRKTKRISESSLDGAYNLNHQIKDTKIKLRNDYGITRWQFLKKRITDKNSYDEETEMALGFQCSESGLRYCIGPIGSQNLNNKHGFAEKMVKTLSTENIKKALGILQKNIETIYNNIEEGLEGREKHEEEGIENFGEKILQTKEVVGSLNKEMEKMQAKYAPKEEAKEEVPKPAKTSIKIPELLPELVPETKPKKKDKEYITMFVARDQEFPAVFEKLDGKTRLRLGKIFEKDMLCSLSKHEKMSVDELASELSYFWNLGIDTRDIKEKIASNITIVEKGRRKEQRAKEKEIRKEHEKALERILGA